MKFSPNFVLPYYVYRYLDYRNIKKNLMSKILWKWIFLLVLISYLFCHKKLNPSSILRKIQFVPSKKLLLPGDTLLHKFFYDDAVKREILGRSLFGLKYKARFLEDTVSKNELILSKCDGSGKVTFWSRKHFGKCQFPHVINLKSMCYHPPVTLFEYALFSFSSVGNFVK